MRQDARCTDGQHHANRGAGERDDHALPNDRADDPPPSRAEREADADFLRTLRHSERQRAVQPDCREQNGQRRRVADKERAHSNGTREGGHAHRKRDRFGDRHAGIDAVHRATQLGEERGGIAGDPYGNPRIDLTRALPEGRVDP
jgi:hypothetical protein